MRTSSILRSQVCATLLGIALLTASCPGSLADAAFTFAQLADVQLGFTSGNKDLSPEAGNFRLAIEKLNQLKPAFVILTGDQLNEAQNTRQIRLFWQIMSQLHSSIPVYLVPGNHDLAGHDEIAIQRYKRFFGSDHYGFEHGGCRFIVLNSHLIKQDPNGRLASAQREWFVTELAKAKPEKARHIVVVTHHPWFVGSADEPDEYFNIAPLERKKWLDHMSSYGVKLAVAGHRHTGSSAEHNGLRMVVAGSVGKSLGPDPVGIMLYTVGRDISHTFIPLR